MAPESTRATKTVSPMVTGMYGRSSSGLEAFSNGSGSGLLAEELRSRFPTVGSCSLGKAHLVGRNGSRKGSVDSCNSDGNGRSVHSANKLLAAAVVVFLRTGAAVTVKSWEDGLRDGVVGEVVAVLLVLPLEDVGLGKVGVLPS